MAPDADKDRGDVQAELRAADLAARSSRTPNFQAENDVLLTLAAALLDQPDTVLQQIVEALLTLSRADSAGIGILRDDDGSSTLEWVAVAGHLAHRRGARISPEDSPCGLGIERNEVLLFRDVGRRFPILGDVTPPIGEFLIAPVHDRERPVGTAWVAKQSADTQFDVEDARMLQRLARFAAVARGVAKGAAERERVQEALLQREDRFRTLIGQIKDYAIFRTDEAGHPVSWNQGVESIFGYTREEFIGSSFDLPFLPEDIAARVPERELEQARRQGVANDDRWLRRKNGEPFYATGMTTRLTNSAGDCIGFSKVLRDDTQGRLAQDRLEKSEERYRTIVENVRDYAIFALDPAGRVTEWPEGAQRVKGYTIDEVIGRHVSMFYTPEDVAAGEVERELEEAAAVGRAEREAWRLCRSGQRIWVNEIATAVRALDGSLTGFTKISRDLTDRRRIDQALREADQRKDEFLATLAHELRNPLAPLRTGLHIARLSSRSDSALQRTVEMMDRQLSHLVRLVDDLLDVGRIASGKVVLHPTRVNLGEVLARSIEASQAIIDAHGHELSVETGDADLFVEADVDRLAQVFSNLLSNAAKYTERGGRIGIDVRREDSEVVVRVTDSGIGIPVADMPHVFDLFSQVRAHQGHAEGGLGIGLSIVRSLVAMHGGSVSVFSEGTGKGSTFTTRLPLALAADDPVVSASGLDAPAPGHARRILVADDNLDAVESLAAVLRLDGHEVVTARNGHEAVERARDFSPEVAILDLGMPGMDGVEAAQQIRRLPGGDRAVLVALTGWGQDRDRTRTRAAGFDWHLVKPVVHHELAAALASRPVG